MKRISRGLAVAFLTAALLANFRSAALPDTAAGLSDDAKARAIAACRQPIQQYFYSLTPKDYYESDMERLHRTMIEAYRKVGRHDPAWDEQVLPLLQAAARQEGNPGSVSIDALQKAGRRLEALGCSDPLVLFILASNLQGPGDRPEAVALARRCLQGFRQTAYPASMRWPAALLLLSLLPEAPGPSSPEQRELEDLAIRWIAEAAGDGSYLDGEQMAFFRRLDRDCRGPLRSSIQEVYKAVFDNPKADPYIRGVAGGRLHIGLAWEARGGGLVGKDTEEGRSGFAGNMDKARSLLTAAWNENLFLPAAPVEMISVALAGYLDKAQADGRKETLDKEDLPRYWFNMAVYAQFDCIEAYERMEPALLPRWGGSPEALYSFGLDCLETRRYQTMVPLRFYHVLQRIGRDIEGGESYWRYPGTYERLKTMFAAYDKTLPVSARPVMKARHIGVAWRCGEYAEARRLIAETADQIDRRVFTSEFGLEFEDLSARVKEPSTAR